MMTWWRGCCFVLFLILSVGFCKETKHESLLRISKSKTKAISWNSKQYSKYLKTQTTTPRPYGVIAIFTAREPKYGCRMCVPTDDVFKAVAKAYGAAQSRFSDKPDLFFAIVDIAKASEVFMKNDITQAPFVTYFPPDGSNPDAKVSKLGEMDIGTIPRLINYVYKTHGIRIPKPVNTFRSAVVVLVVAGVVAAVGTFSMFYTDTILKFPWLRMVWMCGSFAFFFFSVSGMVFCIIRSPQAFVYQSSTAFQFINPDGRNQYVLEGLIVGVLQIGTAIAFIFALKKSRPVGNPSIFRSVLQTLMVTFGLSLGVYFLMRLFQLYSFKNRWYSLSKTLPGGLEKFLFSGSMKNSGFLMNWTRRLVKLAKYWLFDYQNWKAFEVKAISLLKLKPVLAFFKT